MLAITPAESKRTSWLALACALALHLAFIAFAARMQRARPAHVPPLVTEIFEIEAPPPPAPSKPMPEPEPAPRAPAPRAHAAPRPARTMPSAAPPSPASAPAASDASEVLDFGSTLVTSTASSSSFAMPGAAAHGPKRSPATTTRTRVGGSGTSDLSRAPALAGATEWRCPFPLEADDASIDHAVVSLRVEVASTGSVLSARVLDDPGHGFAQSARSCALRKRFAPALDRTGAPVRATTTVLVTFDR